MIYQLQIELLRSKPGIWRRILVPSNMLLSDLHKVIQTVMGWTNSHLHQFIKDRTFYQERLPGDNTWGEMNNVDYKGMTIASLLKAENDEMIYEYDFGDGWEHQIVLEKILPKTADQYYPVCIGGRMNCPPEDCGGIPGYLEMLKILKQPDHEEYDEYITWLGGEFDPLYFNIERANDLLRKKDFGLPDPAEVDVYQGSPAFFEGYSPFEMQQVLYSVFDEHSPVVLLKPSVQDYKMIPILNQVKYLAGRIAEQKELKLTSKGFLPVKIVADLYGQGFIKDEDIESGLVKLYKETDSITTTLPRLIMEISGLTKKRNNKLSLTKKAERFLSDDDLLLRLIIQVFGYKFNWAFFDGYGENNIGQLGFAFTLILLDKYGHEKQTDRFYAGKYFTAFPQLKEDLQGWSGTTIGRGDARCYSIRTFDRFLDFFGVIKIEKERGWDKPKFITKTDLFDRLFRINPPAET